jgi:prolyl 4-hydroxylase
MYPKYEVMSQFTFSTVYTKFKAFSDIPLLDHVPPQIEMGLTEDIAVTTLSHLPHILELQNFLSPDECEHLISLAVSKNELAQSTVGDKQTAMDVRTSSTMWLDFNDTPVVTHIMKRIWSFMQIHFDPGTAWKVAEKPQFLRYEVQQFYSAHHDFFSIQKETSLEMMKGRSRFATFFIYLNNVTEGGQTCFPSSEFSGRSTSDACNAEKFCIQPSQGKALMWYNMLPDGNFDEYTLHAACPVLQGIKYAMNIWFWDPKRLD